MIKKKKFTQAGLDPWLAKPEDKRTNQPSYLGTCVYRMAWRVVMDNLKSENNRQ